MSRELEPAPLLIMSSNNLYHLREALAREQARRAILVRSDVIEVRPGLWQVAVIQLRPIRPRWVKPVALTGGAVVGLAGVGTLSWWLVSAVANVLAGIGVTALAGFAALVALAWLLGRRGGGGGHGGGQLDVHVRYRP